MDDELEKFLKILASTPIKKIDALNHVTEDDLDRLEDELFILKKQLNNRNEDIVIISSPLLPIDPIDDDETIRNYRRHVRADAGGFSHPIKLFNQNERKCIFSALMNQLILFGCINLTDDNLSNEQKNKRLDKIKLAFHVYFDNEVKDDKLKNMDDIIDSLKVKNK